MTKINLNEKDIHICGFCILWSKDLSLCLLNGENKEEEDSCDKWVEDKE
jgi:hypothetical protein